MNYSVYVLDDEEPVCEIMRIVLESRGFRVKTATDGEKGLRLVLDEPPDILLVDIKMPKLNGFELINKLKNDPQYASIPIIIITSLTSESRRSDNEWKEKLGVQDFISKPFEPLEMVKRIEAILNINQPPVAEKDAGSN